MMSTYICMLMRPLIMLDPCCAEIMKHARKERRHLLRKKHVDNAPLSGFSSPGGI